MKYVALFLVVVLGVACGNLLSDWIAAELAAYRVKQALAERSQSSRGAGTRADEGSRNPVAAAEQLLRGQQEQAREQRRRDRDGTRLARTCEEWRSADAQLRSETTSAEAKKHCGYYDRYVNDGILPGRK